MLRDGFTTPDNIQKKELLSKYFTIYEIITLQVSARLMVPAPAPQDKPN